MRRGDVALNGGESLKARLSGYDRPTLQLLALADGWAPAELCGPLREVTKAKVTLRTFTVAEAAEDYSHLSLFLGDGAPGDVFAPALAFLNEGDAP